MDLRTNKTNFQKGIDQLPKTSGVYFFSDEKNFIYIGKAINIKDRVKNHFFQPSYRDNLFIHRVVNIEYIETGSEIEALILEANLIKKHQPRFNVVWRDDKNYFYVAISKDERPAVFITHQKSDPKAKYIGPFIEGAALKKILKYLRRVFPFYTTTRHPKTACTWCHLGLCPGPNPNLPVYKKNLKKLELILQGKRKTVFYALRREMELLAKANKFEEAAKVRDKMNALQNIMQHAHVIESAKITNEKWHETQATLQGILQVRAAISKIECYDISNIQGTSAVGSMVVFVDGMPDKSQYKKFRIRMKNEPNDIAMLAEVLGRRLTHPEWEYPQIMLIDGGIAQLNVAIRAKNECVQKIRDRVFSVQPKIQEIENIKIISIAKGRQELFIEGKKEPIPLKNLPQEIYNLIKHLDDEAHRFAITYHKKVRKRALLD